METLHHRLAAVWFADIVGYTRQATEDEERALRVVQAFQEAARAVVRRGDGRIVKFIGDATLAEFASTDAAVRAALQLPFACGEHARRAGVECPTLRIAVHVGDVATTDDGDVYGDGVNLAARIVREVEPGEVWVSEDVWRQLRHRPRFTFEERGAPELKGLDPVALYAVTGEEAGPWEGREAEPTGARRRFFRPRASLGPVPRLVRSIRPGYGLAAAAAVVAAIVAIWIAWDARSGQTDPHLSAEVVAVLPFNVRGSEGIEYLGPGMVDLLSTKLGGTQGLRAVDPHALMIGLADEGSEPFDIARAREIARRFGAGYFILGTVVEASGRLHLDATLYSSQGNVSPVRATMEGSAEDLLGLVDQLAARLLAARFSGIPGATLASVTTDSLAALKAYLEGQRAYHLGRFQQAIDAFERAVEIDSLFALAHHRLALTASWVPDFALAARSTEAAMRHVERLPLESRRVMTAFAATLEFRPNEAEQILQRHLRAHPDDVEAWFLLGDLFVHYNPFRGRTAAEAKEPFARGLALDPGNQAFVEHLLLVAAMERDTTALRGLLPSLDPASDQSYEWNTFYGVMVRDEATQKNLPLDLARKEDVVVRRLASLLVRYAEDAESAELTAAELTRSGRPDSARARGFSLLFLLHARENRWDQARQDLAKLASLEPDQALVLHSYYAAASPPLGLLDDPAGLLPLLERRITATTSGPDAMQWRYLSGLVALRQGNVGTALRRADEIEALGARDDNRALARFLNGSLRGHVASRSGESARALEIMPAFPVGVPLGTVLSFPAYTAPFDRFTRGRLLEDRGRAEEARGWYRGLWESPAPYDAPFFAVIPAMSRPAP